MTEIQFTVPGIPEPKGSTKAFLPFGLTNNLIKAIYANAPAKDLVAMVKALRPVVMSDNPALKNWQKIVAQYAMLDFRGMPWEGPVELSIQFYLPRCKAAEKRQWHITRPDIDKLERAVKDALAGIVYEDDSQIVRGWISKDYEIKGDGGPRAVIRAIALEAQQQGLGIGDEGLVKKGKKDKCTILKH